MDGLIAYALSKKYTDEVGRSILDAGFKTQVEQDRSILQTAGQEKILYFIPKTTAKPSDGYDEYVYSNNAWEQVGATDVDLSSIDYNDLQNKPQIGLAGKLLHPLAGFLRFNPHDFFMDSNEDFTENYLSASTNIFTSFLSPENIYEYDFANFKTAQHNGVYRALREYLTNIPEEMTDAGSVIYIYHFIPELDWENQNAVYDLIRFVVYKRSTDSKIKMWAQTAGLKANPSFRTWFNVINATSWADMTSDVGYELTPQDKADIADIVLQELPTTQGVQYGNTSN